MGSFALTDSCFCVRMRRHGEVPPEFCDPFLTVAAAIPETGTIRKGESRGLSHFYCL